MGVVCDTLPVYLGPTSASISFEPLKYSTRCAAGGHAAQPGSRQVVSQPARSAPTTDCTPSHTAQPLSCAGRWPSRCAENRRRCESRGRLRARALASARQGHPGQRRAPTAIHQVRWPGACADAQLHSAAQHAATSPRTWPRRICCCLRAAMVPLSLIGRMGTGAGSRC